MTRKQTVVGIGEVLLAAGAADGTVTGLAACAALAAVRVGQRGVAVSRLGQDDAASEVTEHLRAAGVEVAHLQSDPDLPTGRCFGASGASTRARAPLDEAYANLQWDYDLPDLARAADVVIFGGRAAHHGQTRTVIHQFLDECPTALRCIDLTNRAGTRLDRAAIAPLTEAADVAIVDAAALAALAVAAANETNLDPAVDTLRRRHEVGTVVLLEPTEDGSLRVRGRNDGGSTPPVSCPGGSLMAAMVTMLVELRAGRDLADALQRAARAATYASKHPEQPIPAEALEA